MLACRVRSPYGVGEVLVVHIGKTRPRHARPHGVNEQEGVLDAWEGGSAATHGADALSDVDIQLLVEDGNVAAGLQQGAMALFDQVSRDVR